MRPTSFLAAAIVLVHALALADDFETPPAQPAAASLPPELASGPDFHVREPVESDGLMHHYVIDSRFGEFTAYGGQALKVRVGEMAALTELAKKNDVGVVAKAVETNVQDQAKTVKQFVTHPVGTVTGIPRGIGHLFSGAKAQAHELGDEAKKDTSGCDDASATKAQSGPSGSAATSDAAPPPCNSAGTTRKIARNAQTAASRYADKYLGLSAAERRYYQSLHVDPYTDNKVLRRAVHHLAKIEATTNLGLHFAGIPGVPYLNDVRRAMDAVYNEDPAVLRARQRKVLADDGLSAAEIERFENTWLLSPTRQLILEEAAKSLVGVDGRDEIYRHAMSVTSEAEVEVFIESVRLLVRVHASHPVVHLLPGLRLPCALTRDGRIVVVGAFDAVSWTQDVAEYESSLHAALPPETQGLDLWLSGSISPQAQHELAARGWQVHTEAWASLPESQPQAAQPQAGQPQAAHAAP